MLRKLSQEIVPVTRELADQFVTLTPAPGDRGVKPAILAILDQAARASRIYPYTWATCYCRETGVTYRVNGKHGSTVFANRDVPLLDACITVARYEADTLAEVADLYKDFDRQESSRTSGDITRAYAGTEPRLADVPDYIVKRCTTGIAISIWGIHYPTHADAAKRSAEAMQHVDFILFAHRIMGGRSAIFTKASTVAAMFEGFQESPCEAGTFWTAVREGTGIDPKSPDRKLRDYLLTRKIISPNGTGQKKRGPSASQYEVLNRCLKEWHRWQALNARQEAA